MNIDGGMNDLHQFNRLFETPERTFFLWGPRQSGKTTLLRQRFQDAHWIDLLRTDQRIRYEREPFRLREEVRILSPETWVVIDEIQKVPALLDEVHGLIASEHRKFVLCGSSARKIRHSHANLLGGRAVKRELLGFSARELDTAFSLEQMLNRGVLPPHYLAGSDRAAREGLAAYVDIYLKEEILDEGLTRNLPVFADFLRAAAIGDTEVINFSNIGRECGVATSTVRGYYEILVDTLLGAFVPAFTRRAKRRTQQAPKFYFRDLGMVNHLTRRGAVVAGNEVFGKAFENYIFHELSVCERSMGREFPISYWRLTTGVEVDFILGDAEIAIEVKGKARLHGRDTRNLLQFRTEHPEVRQLISVCLEERVRLTDDGVLILPLNEFLKLLWAGDLNPK
jgi:predicted AAA+ superfamily ATPase